MIQEQHNLLLKDLCSRLPYGVKCNVGDDKPYTLSRIEIDDKNGHLLDFIERKNGLDMQVYLSEVKPYLFPISSINRKQRNELCDLIHNLNVLAINGKIEDWVVSRAEIDWYDKNHFDYRELIPMGLAEDATDKNIY